MLINELPRQYFCAFLDKNGVLFTERSSLPQGQVMNSKKQKNTLSPSREGICQAIQKLLTAKENA